MSETIKLNVCPKCNAPIVADAPQGLCPKCVLGGAAMPTESGVPTATDEVPTISRVAAAFPQLEIIELIGRGGMGFVFKARQPHLDRFVALKLLPDKLAKDPQFAERFNREGRFLARLNHPNIVGVFDFGQAGGFYYLMMEHVDGVNLRQAMRAGRFSPAEALAIVPKICEALQYAHEQGVLHRDIKPENILLDAKGRVKIADFGIAKLVGEDAHAFTLTGTGAALGTPHYMAPEQLEKPNEVDHRADIYSLGVVLYEMLTGELPIGRFAAPSTKTPMDQRVDEIVFRALEKERELRQKSATEFKTQLDNVTSTPSASSSHSEPDEIRRKGKSVFQNILYGALAALLTLVLIVGVTGLVTIYLPKEYRASALFMLRNNRGTSPSDQAELAAALRGVLSQPVIERVIADLKLQQTWRRDRAISMSEARDRVIQKLRLEVPRNTAVVTVSWQSQHPNEAATIASKIVEVYCSQNPNASAVEFATTPIRPVRPNMMLNLGIAFTVALVFAPIIGTLVGVFSFWRARNRLPGGKLRDERQSPLPTNEWAPRFYAIAWTVVVLCLVNFLTPHITRLGNSPEQTLCVGLSRPWLVNLPRIDDRGAVHRDFRFVPDSSAFYGGIVGVLLATALMLARNLQRPSTHSLPSRKAIGAVSIVVLTVSGAGFALAIFQSQRDTSAPNLPNVPTISATNEEATNAFIRFTFTAVELREAGGVRWLAIDYLDDVHGEVEKVFMRDSNIPGFKAETRTSEFAGGDKSAPVRHQRVEYRMPNSVPREQLEKFRDTVAKALNQKSIRLKLSEEKELFTLVDDGGALKARIKVMASLKISINSLQLEVHGPKQINQSLWL
ncbi:MAG TPA: protein kinase, partial [Candidatus Acidoferrum sp.]|nr:protein kinase [Candidatus Acidoferrum sp.]